MHSVSIVGCGYTGCRLAARLRTMNVGVRGYATGAPSLQRIAATGAEAAALDLDLPLSSLDFHEYFRDRLIYYSVPPAAHGPSHRTGDLRLERFLGSLDRLPKEPTAIRRLIYLSTTGVYGDRDGAMVNEDTPPAPKSARAVRRLAAENAVRQWAESRGHSWCILRVAAIYGPGRLPLERLLRQEPMIAPEEAPPTNRIHVEDLVTACIAAGLSARADRRIYNVADGNDESLSGYLMRVARITKLPIPPLIGRAEAMQTFSESTLSFLSESRRVDNSRMRDELGVALAYHDIDAGIRASL